MKQNIIFLDLSDLMYQLWVIESKPASMSDHFLEKAVTLANKIRSEHAFTHVIGVFDSRVSFRNELLSNYRHHGAVLPDSIYESSERLADRLSYDGWPPIIKREAESFDIISTLVPKLNEIGARVHIYSSDKRLLQLVNDCTHLHSITYRYPLDKHINQDWVTRKWKVNLSQVVDYLLLVGHKSVNWPGVQGIGAKRAAALLDEYRNMEGIMLHAPAIDGSVGRSIRGADKEYIDNGLCILRPKLVGDLNLSLKMFRHNVDQSSHGISTV